MVCQLGRHGSLEKRLVPLKYAGQAWCSDAHTERLTVLMKKDGGMRGEGAGGGGVGMKGGVGEGELGRQGEGVFINILHS